MNKKHETSTENFTFQTEVESLLHLLAHSLYSNPEIFLRELISNASDALTKIKFLAQTDASLLKAEEALSITLSLDEQAKTFSIEDNGLGMSKQDLIQNLGTIAKSGTLAYLKTHQEGAQKEDLEDLIGKFGVGFYSVFMVADWVTVESYKTNEDSGYIWKSDGKGSFSLEPSSRKDRGTKISFRFKESMESLANKWRIEGIIHQYSDFVPYPIKLNDVVLTRKPALWSRQKKDISEQEYQELYKYITHRQENFLFSYHYHSDAPLQFQTVLFVPEKKERSMFQVEKEIQVQLYSRKVFIQNDCKALLPAWLRFVAGVVDSYDLPLNVSRQTVQDSPVLAKIQNFLCKRLLGEWKKLKEKDAAKFTDFYQEFGIFLKEGLHTDFQYRDDLLQLYHAASSKSKGALKTLEDYLLAMPADQKEIYYAIGKDQASLDSSPNMEIFLQKGIEVLYLFDEVDDFILSSLHDYKDKKLVNIDRSGIDLADLQTPAQEKDKPAEKEQSFEEKKLLEYVKDVLQDKVSQVIASKRLVNSPATLVTKQDAPSAQMEKLFKMMQENYQTNPHILEVNLGHKLIQGMVKVYQKNPQDPELKSAILTLFDSCFILENTLTNPLESSLRMQKTLEKYFDLYQA